ncbi:MAG: hypothetical protein AB7L91_18045 [Dehalococcoidia bacterium]
MAGLGPKVTLTFAGDDSRLKRTLQSVESSTSTLGDKLKAPALAFAGLGAAAGASGVVAGAAIAGLGVGIVGLGVAAAAQSEKVKQAFTSLGEHVKKETQKLAAPYEKALLGIEQKTRATFDRVKPMLGEMFNVSAPYLDKLADGLLGFVEGAMPGLKTALAESKPVILAISDGLKRLGPALGEMFKKITGEGGAQSAADSITLLFDGVVWLLPKLGELIRLLMDWAPVLIPVAAGLLGLVVAMKVVNTAMAVYRAVVALTAVWTVVKWAWMATVTVAKWAWMALMATLNAIKIGVVWTVQTLLAVGRIVLAWTIAAVTVVAQWVWMGLQALIQAGRMAAAWFIALGPIGWAIALIALIVTLVIIYWDEIVAWTKAAWTAVSTWVGEKVDQIKQWVSEKLKAAKDAVVNAWESAKAATISAWESLKNSVKEKATAVVDFVKGLPGRILTALGNLGSLLYNSGKALLQGLWDGAVSKFNAVRDWVSQAMADLREYFPFSPAKKGPFSGAGYTIHSGQALMEDFGRGIQRGPDLGGVASSALRGAQGAFSGPVGAAAGDGRGNSGGPTVHFTGNTSDALAKVIMQMIRTGQIQIA